MLSRWHPTGGAHAAQRPYFAAPASALGKELREALQQCGCDMRSKRPREHACEYGGYEEAR